MLRPKYRNIIPSELEEKKNKDKSAYCEVYDIGGMESKAKFIIKSLYTEKSHFEIHGNFLYQIKNCSHFEIDSEIDFSKSSNYRTQEKNAFEPNKTLFISHIEPFQDLNKSLIKEKIKKEDDEDGICKVQYNRGYKIKANIKLAFTFPSLEKQLYFVNEDHKEIYEFIEQWKKFKPSQIEQLLLFHSNNGFNDDNNNNIKKKVNINDKSVSRSEYYNLMANSKYEVSKKKNVELHSLKRDRTSFEIIRDFANANNLYILANKDSIDNRNNNNINNENNINQTQDRIICFVDESFPPCQEEYRIIDLNKEINTTKRFSSTEKVEDKKRKIVFHYRAIENLIPEKKLLFNINEVNCYDIKCGLFKNKNIISVFAHLADYPYILSKLFVENNINSIGIYKLQLFYQNFWTDVYIDKYIPCFPCYFPLYTYSETSLWPCALEKALAKIFRGYEKLKYISFFELYKILTGFPIINFKKIYKNIETKKLRVMYELVNKKENYGLDEFTSDFKFSVNSKYDNDAIEIVSKDDVINSFLSHSYNNYYKSNNEDTNWINIAFNAFKKENKSSAFSNEDDNKIAFNNEIYYSNPYLLAFYASDSYLKYLLKIEMFPFSKKNLMRISNKIFPVKYANEKYVVIKSIYNYQLKKFLYNFFYEDTSSFNNSSNKVASLTKETETLTLTWDILFTIFDNVILIKSDNYNELHFRNGFVRCQDIKSPDYDRILAHSYYELSIKRNKKDNELVRFKEENKKEQSSEKDENNKNDKKSEKMKNENIRSKSININLDSFKFFKTKGTKKNGPDKRDLIPVTIVINLSNDHFLDSSYYSNEMDLKIGILQLTKKYKLKYKDNYYNYKKDTSDPFNGLNPILVTCPDFQIGYSLVYDLFLEEGNYIIVPMTMGYCMQKNEKIKSFYYSLRDKKGIPLPINKTVIPRFLDDVFYLNDPFGKNYLEYKVINEVAKNILDNKGHKIKKIDESSLFNNFSKIGESDFDISKEKFGLSKLSFEDFIFDKMTLLTELQKKQCMQNLGYENNTYPYLSRFIGVSFYFGKFNISNDMGIIKIIPKNNLSDSNMDKFVNIRTLEKSISQIKGKETGNPKRIYYPSKEWYTIEGVYLRKNPFGKDEKKNYDFEKDIYAGRNVFFSTNSNNITAVAHSGKIKFLLYVVYDVLKGKDKMNNINDESLNVDNNDDEENKKESESSNEEEEEIKSKESEKNSDNSKSNKNEEE